MKRQAQPKFTDTTASVLLDTFRGVAALLVCISHWRYLFFVNYPALPLLHRKLWAIPYALCTLGHASVTVFFVLSGYLVGGHALRAALSGRWSWKHYLLQRGVRLYVVLLPALALGGLLDFIALHRNIAPLLYHGKINNFLTPDVPSHLHWSALVGNLFFLQPRFVPTWGSNGPLWSLSNEFWYYMLFPCLLLAFFVRRRPAYRISLMAIAVLLIALLGPSYLIGFAVWLMGAALALIPIRPTSAFVRWGALAVYIPIFVFSDRSAEIGPSSGTGPLGFATAVLLWTVLGAVAPASHALWVRGSRSLAAFSYTLYLVHVPFLTLLAGMLCGNARWLPQLPHLLLAGLAFLLALLLAFLLSRMTEAKNLQVRHWIEARL